MRPLRPRGYRAYRWRRGAGSLWSRFVRDRSSLLAGDDPGTAWCGLTGGWMSAPVVLLDLAGEIGYVERALFGVLRSA
jgi:hypothetical protein